MDYATGKVKKYSREYSRTLKDGTKKKYKTEQVQITIPKQENIFEDEEEVLILPNDSLEDIDSNNEIFAALEFQNFLLKEDIAISNQNIEDKDNEIDELNEKIKLLEIELENSSLKKDIDNAEAKINNEFLELQKAYVKQLNKVELLQSELESMKAKELYYKGMIRKLKNFILHEV